MLLSWRLAFGVWPVVNVVVLVFGVWIAVCDSCCLGVWTVASVVVLVLQAFGQL